MKIIIYILLSIINSSPLLIDVLSHLPVPADPLNLNIKDSLANPFTIFNTQPIATPAPTTTPTNTTAATAATTVTPTSTAVVEVPYIFSEPVYGDATVIPYDDGYVEGTEPVYDQILTTVDYGQDTTYTENDQPNAQYTGKSVEDQALNYINQYYDSSYNNDHGYTLN